MPAINLDNFLHSLARWMVQRAGAGAGVGGVRYDTPAPWGLFRHRAIERFATDPHSVLRLIGGIFDPRKPAPAATIECVTVARDGAADRSLQRGQRLFETLLGPDGRPVRGVVVPARDAETNLADGDWRLIGVTPIQRLGLIGYDESQRAISSFSARISFNKER